MAQVVTIIAEMADGAILTERTADFGRFVDVVLGFRRDPDVRRLVWREEAATASDDHARAA